MSRSPDSPSKVPAHWARTAATLAEALPHIQSHDGHVVVVKLGGATVDDAEALSRLALDLTLVRQCGVRPVVVHGGGPQINRTLKQLGIESQFEDGQRVTCERTIEVVEMVLAGTVNKRIVSAVQRQGGRAAGLSGRDGRLLETLPRKTADGADLGFVGTPKNVDPKIVIDLLKSDFIPIIAPLGWGADGHAYNVNADVAAGAVAAAIKAKRLLLLTDVGGVLDAEGSLVPSVDLAQTEKLIESGTVSGGMIPKLRTACEAVETGVEAAVILDGTVPHATLLELFTDHGAGTLVGAAESS